MTDAYKFTDEVKKKFLDLLSLGNSRKSALEQCGVTRFTLRNHMIADPDFAQDVKDAEAESIELVEDALMERALGGNTTAQIFFLKCRRGDKWNDKPTQQVGFSREELEAQIEQLIEIAVLRLPESERPGFIADLRRISGLDQGARQAIEAPASKPD